MVSKEQINAKPPMQSNQSTNDGTNHDWRKIIVSIIIGVIIGSLLIIIANFGISIYKYFSPPKVPQNIKMAAPQASPQAASPATKPPPKKIAESSIKKNIPKFDLKMIAVNIPQNDVYKSQALLTIKSKTSLKNVYLKVRSKSIISFYVSSQGGGLVILGLTEKRGGYAFTNISNAHGQYIMEIISKKPDNIKITCDYK